MHYATLITPQKLRMGTIGGDPLYADCAECGSEDAVIHGGIQDNAQRWAIRRLPNGLFKQCVYCEPCYAALLAAADAQQVTS